MPSGGARPGAGRHRTTLTISMPALVLLQYQQVARIEGVDLADVVKLALQDWLADWQDAHDTEQDARATANPQQ